MEEVARHAVIRARHITQHHGIAKVDSSSMPCPTSFAFSRAEPGCARRVWRALGRIIKTPKLIIPSEGRTFPETCMPASRRCRPRQPSPPTRPPHARAILLVMNNFNKAESRGQEGDPESWPRSVAVLVRQVLFALREVEKGGWAHLEQIAGVRRSLQAEYRRQRPADREFGSGADL